MANNNLEQVRPSHYPRLQITLVTNDNNIKSLIEVISLTSILDRSGMPFSLCNVFKYLIRYNYEEDINKKNEDVRKAYTYLRDFVCNETSKANANNLLEQSEVNLDYKVTLLNEYIMCISFNSTRELLNKLIKAVGSKKSTLKNIIDVYSERQLFNELYIDEQ